MEYLRSGGDIYKSYIDTAPARTADFSRRVQLFDSLPSTRLKSQTTD